MKNVLQLVQECIVRFDDKVIDFLHRYGHGVHSHSLGVLFIWLGLLKSLGHETGTSLLAQTIYLGPPDIMVVVLALWEIAIGLTMLYKPLVRISLFLMVLRLPGTALAFVLLPNITFIQFPLVPTPEGQYLLKDFVMFFAAMAITGTIKN